MFCLRKTVKKDMKKECHFIWRQVVLCVIISSYAYAAFHIRKDKSKFLENGKRKHTGKETGKKSDSADSRNHTDCVGNRHRSVYCHKGRAAV